MGLQRKRPPDAADHGLTQSAALRHRAGAPVRGDLEQFPDPWEQGILKTQNREPDSAKQGKWPDRFFFSKRFRPEESAIEFFDPISSGTTVEPISLRGLRSSFWREIIKGHRLAGFGIRLGLGTIAQSRAETY
jgi:hypothetical protein